MKTSIILYKILIICGLFWPAASVVVKFTNVECQSYDPDVVEIKMCRLKAVGRNQIALNTHVKLLRTPIDNITVSA